MPTGKPRDPRKERFWRQAIRRWRKSGLSAAAFCLDNGLTEAHFYAWRRTLAARDAESMSFAQVHVLTDETVDNGSGPPPVTSSGALELVLANGRLLRIGAGFDQDTLRRLLPLVEEAPPC